MPDYHDPNVQAAETAKGLRRWVEHIRAPSGVVPILLLEDAANHIERLLSQVEEK